MKTMSSSNSSELNGIPGHYLLTQIIISFVLATPALISNVILLLTVYQGKIWRKPIALLVINLSFCDFLTGLGPGYGSLFYDITLYFGQDRGNLLWLKQAITIAAVVTNIVASCTIAAMAFDRLFAVSSPFYYQTRVTTTKITVFITVIWIYAVLFSTLAMVLPKTAFVLLYCHLHVSLPLIVLPVVYWKTYRALRCHNNQIQNAYSCHGRDMEQITSAHKNRERRMISALLLVLVLFYVTFAPQFVAQNMLAIHSSFLEMESFNFFLYSSNKFLLVNCTINPFIYAWRIPKYRKAFNEVFGEFIRRKRSSYVVPVTFNCARFKVN